MATDAEAQLTILIAEDSAADRMILESIVAKSGHVPESVANGEEAVSAFREHRPDIILLDVMMPKMGGVEASKVIRQEADGEFIPIIFLTSLSDTESLVQCLDAGGDDFLSKPYNHIILNSKIRAFSRTRDLHRTLADHKNQIEQHNRHLIQEQTVAKQVFDNIAHAGCLSSDTIRYYMSPMAIFNGDVLVAEVSPTGSMMVLLGDFTGHGLPAAIGSMPLATTFYGMVRKGFSMSDILWEINYKLHQILPIGFFCCATFVDINFVKRRLKIWNGGLPQSFLYRAHRDEYEMIQSANLPLGVKSEKEFSPEITRYNLEVGDRFFMWSDGIFEARDASGHMFGEERLHELMMSMKGRQGLFDEILFQVHSHIGMSDKDDDLSLVEILVEDVELIQQNQVYQTSPQSGLLNWNMNFEVNGKSLQSFDPLPLIVNVMNEVPGLRQNNTVLYTLLAELFNNALEHGVLGLPSTLKGSPKGFIEYYNLREERLKQQQLDTQFVKFILKHEMTKDGGLLFLRIVDSGPGFDFNARKVSREASENTNFYGRGLSLVASMCESLTVRPPGNDVEAVYRWRYEV